MIYIYRAAQHEQGQWNVSLNRQYIGTGMGQGHVKEIQCPLLILQGPPPKAATKTDFLGQNTKSGKGVV